MDSGVESIGLCCWIDPYFSPGPWVELDQQQGNKHGFNGLSIPNKHCMHTWFEGGATTVKKVGVHSFGECDV